MAALTITPKKVVLTTSYTDLDIVVPAGEEWSLDVRVANVSESDVLIRLGIGPDNNTANTLYRVYDLEIPAGEARDVEEKLVLPTGWRLFGRASANDVIHLTATGRKRTTA